jgi:hypothetical protein
MFLYYHVPHGKCDRKYRKVFFTLYSCQYMLKITVTDHTTLAVGKQLQAPTFYDVLSVWGTKAE